MRYITRPYIFVLALLSLSSALAAAPRYARVIVGTREAVLSPRAVVEDGAVYAPVDILKTLGADYAVGDRKATIALADGAVELGLVERESAPMIRLDEAAKALDIEYTWNDSNSTVRLLAKLVSVEFGDLVLTARLTMPVAVSSARLWKDPWRISIDLAGAKVATDAKAYPVSGSGVSQIRLGQFTSDTARVVIDLGRKTGYQVLTRGLSREIKVQVGGASADTIRDSRSSAKPEQPVPVTVTGINVEPDGDSRLRVRISTSGRPTFKSHLVASPVRVVIDVENGSLARPEETIPSEHPLLKDIRTGQQNSTARIVLDVARYVAFTADSDEGGITLNITLPSGAGGKLGDKLIVLDPGHGGNQPGARAGGVAEKNINLLMARRVKAALEEAGARVIMTREDDSYVDLPPRPAMADEYSADFFISIHCNAMPMPEMLSGIETYYHSGQPSSRALAFAVHSRVIQKTGMKDRGARLDTKLAPIGLCVLRNANVPAMLIECGYIDCSKDRSQLCDDTYRGKIAQAVVEGLRDYVEGRMEPEGN